MLALNFNASCGERSNIGRQTPNIHSYIRFIFVNYLKLATNFGRKYLNEIGLSAADKGVDKYGMLTISVMNQLWMNLYR